MTLSDYSQNQEVLYETPEEVPVSFKYDRNELRKKYLKEVFS